jgi:small subunit ribosomal protein S13
LARISGIDLPKSKRIEVGLTYIYGIGPASSKLILEETGISPDIRVDDLSEEDVAKIRSSIDAKFKVEGALRAEINMNIKRLMDIGSYRGLRHRRRLPAHGQRTRTNARTHKGPRNQIGAKKKKK